MKFRKLLPASFLLSLFIVIIMFVTDEDPVADMLSAIKDFILLNTIITFFIFGLISGIYALIRSLPARSEQNKS